MLTLTIEPGQDLFGSILAAAAEAGIRQGTIVSGIGALGPSTVRNVKHVPPSLPVQDSDRLYHRSPGPLELVSLTGWLSRDRQDKPYLHAHFSVSTIEGDEVRVLGGHLSPGAAETWIMTVISVAVHDATPGVVGLDPFGKAENLLLP